MNFEEETPPKYEDTRSSEFSISSNSSSSPSNNVIHFDAQVSLFKPSKRFFCHQDLTSPSMEESQEEELEQVESEEKQSEEEESEDEESEEEDSEDEESEEEESEEEVSESEESENVCLTSDLDDSVSIMSSIPENVMHFNTQTSLFKCSKRFFNNQDLASQSLEISEGEEESEKEENEEEMDEEDDTEVKDVEEENNESEKEEDEDVEEKDEENEEEESEEEDDESEESANDCLTSDSSDRFLYTSSISSDHILHFNQNTTLFKYSRRFFKQDLTSPSMEESEEEELEQVESEEEQSEEEEPEDEESEEEESEAEESEEEDSEEEDSEDEESEEEVSEEEVSESEESENGVLTSDLDDSISIMSSIPENVMHFNTQLCLFKCSKRFFNNQDLASQSIEMSEGEEESEKEDDGEDEEEMDEDNDTEEEEERAEEKDESEEEEESQDEEDEDEEEKDKEDEEKEFKEEDDETEGSVNDCLSSDVNERSFYSSSIPSDHVLHFDHHTILFKYSKRFFCLDLTSPSIEKSENELKEDDNEEEKVEEEDDKEDGHGEEEEGKVSEDCIEMSDEVNSFPSTVVEASNYNRDGEEIPHTVKPSLTQRTSHTSCNVPVST